MSKHTPGPWHYEQKGGGLVGIFPSGIETAVAFTRNNEADARLIAAAPDLLAALRYVYEYYAPMTIFDDETGDTGHDEAMEIVRAAIAKARGEA